MFSTTRQSICQEKREVSGNSYLLILSIQLLKIFINAQCNFFNAQCNFFNV
jgi:hypothetical protein